MSAPTTSHAALIAEVTALRTSLGDAVEMVEALRSERDALVKTAAEFAGDTVIMTVQRDALRAALKCVVAALSQPVQTCEPSQRTAEVLLGDCTFARQTARAALGRAGL